VLATESSTEILPYALPRISACAQRISALLNTDLAEQDAEGQSRLLRLLNAYVSAQDALSEDSRRAMERIRLVSDWVVEQSSNTQCDVGALSAFVIDVFVADDLQHLVLT
jgi:methyl-accepting chemotaxis protein